MKWIINYNKLACAHIHTHTHDTHDTLTVQPHSTDMNSECSGLHCYSNKVINIIERKTNNFMIRSSRNKAIKMCNIPFSVVRCSVLSVLLFLYLAKLRWVSFRIEEEHVTYIQNNNNFEWGGRKDPAPTIKNAQSQNDFSRFVFVSNSLRCHIPGSTRSHTLQLYAFAYTMKKFLLAMLQQLTAYFKVSLSLSP